MSFTAQVKDELSRVEGDCELCAYAQLSAITRVCGTLSFHGPGRYSVRVATETGAVARTMIKLTHELFDLETPLTVRHSNLHKTRNYLIEVPEQDELEADLERLGILLPGRGLAPGVARDLVQNDCCRRAFVRGAFMAGGFIADPRATSSSSSRPSASPPASTAAAAPTPSTSRASTTSSACSRPWAPAAARSRSRTSAT